MQLAGNNCDVLSIATDKPREAKRDVCIGQRCHIVISYGYFLLNVMLLLLLFKLSQNDVLVIF